MLKFDTLLPYRVISQPCVFTFGTFDGVHLGHQKLFQTVIATAREENMLAACLTFKNHPLTVIYPEKAPLVLTAPAEKLALIEAAGFDVVIELEFTPAIAHLTADEFVERLTTMLPIAIFLVGEDVVYGKERAGNRAHLEQMGKIFGFESRLLSRFSSENEPISSTRIRKLLQEGKRGEASRLLGRII